MYCFRALFLLFWVELYRAGRIKSVRISFTEAAILLPSHTVKKRAGTGDKSIVRISSTRFRLIKTRKWSENDHEAAGGQPDEGQQPANVKWRPTTTNLHLTIIIVVIYYFFVSRGDLKGYYCLLFKKQQKQWRHGKEVGFLFSLSIIVNSFLILNTTLFKFSLEDASTNSKRPCLWKSLSINYFPTVSELFLASVFF